MWDVVDEHGNTQKVSTVTCEALADVVIFSHMFDGRKVIDAAYPRYRSVRLGIMPSLTPDDS
jgi:hypothetical protein